MMALLEAGLVAKVEVADASVRVDELQLQLLLHLDLLYAYFAQSTEGSNIDASALYSHSAGVGFSFSAHSSVTVVFVNTSDFGLFYVELFYDFGRDDVLVALSSFGQQHLHLHLHHQHLHLR